MFRFFHVLKTFSLIPLKCGMPIKIISCTKKNFFFGYAANFVALCPFCNYVAKLRNYPELSKKMGNYFCQKLRTYKVITYSLLTFTFFRNHETRTLLLLRLYI